MVDIRYALLVLVGVVGPIEGLMERMYMTCPYYGWEVGTPYLIQNTVQGSSWVRYLIDAGFFLDKLVRLS